MGCYTALILRYKSAKALGTLWNVKERTYTTGSTHPLPVILTSNELENKAKNHVMAPSMNSLEDQAVSHENAMPADSPVQDDLTTQALAIGAGLVTIVFSSLQALEVWQIFVGYLEYVVVIAILFTNNSCICRQRGSKSFKRQALIAYDCHASGVYRRPSAGSRLELSRVPEWEKPKSTKPARMLSRLALHAPSQVSTLVSALQSLETTLLD